MENFNRGTKYLERGNYTKAVQFLRRELKSREFKECYLNLGNALNKLQQPVAACRAFQHAADPAVPFLDGSTGPYADALNNLGLLAYAHNCDATAAELYQRAVAADPKHHDAVFNYSLVLLRQACSGNISQWTRAWQLYRTRFIRSNPTHIAQHAAPWDGVTPHHTCVVLSEQGLGDHIQFARYIQDLQRVFPRVVLQCPQQLHGLWPGVECAVQLDNLDCVSIPLLDLPLHFGVGNRAWLRDTHTPHDFGPGLHIGVCWSGSPTHRNNHARSCAPQYFSALAKFGTLYSIAPAEATRGVRALNSRSWQQSAEFVAGLDLVVTVDTSLVHLAGSLGVPTWLLQPRSNTDFRWGVPGSSCLWYDSVRVVHNPDSWLDVFATVAQQLETFCKPC